MNLDYFHPAVREWFEQRFNQATQVQSQAWPAIQKNQHTLIAAPTGSGKTLAAFLASIDNLIKAGLESKLKDQTHVLYISPLKALSNDIQKNLQEPLQGIRDKLIENGLADVDIKAWVRTGDTPQSEREKMRRKPPHIIVTTPESLYILLTSASGRKILSTVKTVIIDEIHALAGNKRGSHLSLSLERLTSLCKQNPTRIGLSATQKPIGDMAMFLIGNRDDECTIINSGHKRDRDLSIATTSSPLEAVMANEVWGEIYDNLYNQIQDHSTTLIFVNTRRLAERVAKALSERLDDKVITAHHGSLSKEHRLEAEQNLKKGNLSALVTTASLELGIDIGDIDLVCQIGSPRSISGFLQRVGRSGHAIDKVPKGMLYPLSRDDLIECVALLDAVDLDELDTIRIPLAPLDVLAQQIIAEVSIQDWGEQELYELIRRARPYQDINFLQYTDILTMLADGFALKRGRRGAYIHWDRVNHVLRGRRGAKLVALTNGGTIPEQFDYDVVLQPEGFKIGTLNEDFAFESLPGDIFQLGNTSYRMLKVEQGKVFVEDAKGQPPNIPFWFGEAPGRSAELSVAVSRLRQIISDKLNLGIDSTTAWLIQAYPLSLAAAQQVSEYLGSTKATFEELPSQSQIIIERFFDENGDMHVVIHSSYGSRINRAWGLALRKRFCKQFNFELQAAALDDTIILSLSATHSFQLEDIIFYLKSKTVRSVLIQALLTAPMFPTRWRWVANTSLAIPRNRNGKKVPAPFQRNDSEDLIALIFPDQIACQENLAGEREIPDHPLVTQAINDCLEDVMDISGLESLLEDIESSKVRVICKDLTSPSPLAQEILNARPYAFLDDAPAEERRTLAVQQRRFMDPKSANDLGRLSSDAIKRVQAETWPDVRTADELHDALSIFSYFTETEANNSDHEKNNSAFSWKPLFDNLVENKRAVCLVSSNKTSLWVARERMHEFVRLFDLDLKQLPCSPLVDIYHFDKDQALKEILRGRLEVLGPVTEKKLNQSLGLTENAIKTALISLEQDGFVMRGHFTHDNNETEWCERGLLARIHRYTLRQLRSEIEPVSPSDFMRFLFHWHRIDEPMQGQNAVSEILNLLEGSQIPAIAWEKEILTSRIKDYTPSMLDSVCSSGRYFWLRVRQSKLGSIDNPKSSPVSNTPIAIVPRNNSQLWQTQLSEVDSNDKIALSISSTAEKVYHVLKECGASFFSDISEQSNLIPTQCESALGELVANGLVSSDSYAGLRYLIAPEKKKQQSRPNRRRLWLSKLEDAGRWFLCANSNNKEMSDKTYYIAQTLLRKYGVVFRKLLDRESNCPSWRELLYAFRTMEARGEIRGGRFVNGFSGEQFALSDAVGSLRNMRRKQKENNLCSISAADPLNLTGLITPGDRVPAITGNRVLYRDGTPIAISVGGEISFIAELDSMDEWEIRNALLKHEKPVSYYSQFPSRPI